MICGAILPQSHYPTHPFVVVFLLGEGAFFPGSQYPIDTHNFRGLFPSGAHSFSDTNDLDGQSALEVNIPMTLIIWVTFFPGALYFTDLKNYFLWY